MDRFNQTMTTIGRIQQATRDLCRQMFDEVVQHCSHRHNVILPCECYLLIPFEIEPDVNREKYCCKYEQCPILFPKREVNDGS